MSLHWPTAAQARVTLASRRRLRWTLSAAAPSVTAPELTRTTCRPSLTRAAMLAATAETRFWSNSCSALQTTAVPTLTTMRRALTRRERGSAADLEWGVDIAT